MHALTITDVARELGRSPEWLGRNYPMLVRSGKLPPPLLERGGVTWSAPQVYAYLDKTVPPAMRKIAAAYRAAYEAATTAKDDQITSARAALDAEFGGGSQQ